MIGAITRIGPTMTKSDVQYASRVTAGCVKGCLHLLHVRYPILTENGEGAIGLQPTGRPVLLWRSCHSARLVNRSLTTSQLLPRRARHSSRPSGTPDASRPRVLTRRECRPAWCGSAGATFSPRTSRH